MEGDSNHNKVESKKEVSEEIKKYVSSEIEDYVSDKLKIIKAFAYGLASFIIITIAWSLIDQADLIRIIHSKIFPVGTNEVLITAYTGTFTLKASEEVKAKFASAYLAFYSKADENVKFYVSVQHQFYQSEELKRDLFIEVDHEQIYQKPIRTHAGGFRPLKVSNTPGPDSEPEIHQMQFRLNQDVEDFLLLTDEITVTCIILVYGKQ